MLNSIWESTFRIREVQKEPENELGSKSERLVEHPNGRRNGEEENSGQHGVVLASTTGVTTSRGKQCALVQFSYSRRSNLVTEELPVPWQHSCPTSSPVEAIELFFLSLWAIFPILWKRTFACAFNCGQDFTCLPGWKMIRFMIFFYFVLELCSFFFTESNFIRKKKYFWQVPKGNYNILLRKVNPFSN